MEFTTKSDLCKSYLLSETTQDYDKNNYQYKMITKNKIKGLLDCGEGFLDGKYTLQYNVSGKKSLLQEFQEKELQFCHMVSILQGLNTMLMEIKLYLLNEKFVLLTPDLIFWEEDTSQPYFIYCPLEEINEEGKLRALADFFLEHGNHRDEHVVNISYLFYKQTKERFFSLTAFLTVLDKEQSLKFQDNQLAMETTEKRIDGIEIVEESKEVHPDDTELEEKEKEDNKIKKKDGFKTYRLVLSICCLLGSVGVGGIIMLYPLSYQLFIGMVTLATVLVLISVLFLILFLCKKKEKTKTVIEEKKIEEIPFLQEEDMVHEIGETVYLGQSMEIQDSEASYYLEYQTEQEMRRIPLIYLPLTVGKEREKVSLVLEDPSVSRVHCRFVEKKDKIGIIDLNSTNGTKINGILLEQGEIVSIEQGDEITIGTVNCYIVTSHN
ncbi:MAG: DUF6382 domain-containing protein [Eubacteriales bacterium]